MSLTLLGRIGDLTPIPASLPRLPSPRSPTFPRTTRAMCFRFESLKETFQVEVSRAEGRPLDVPLLAPFTIAKSRLEAVGNVAIRVELRNGSVGWGEAPVLPSVTAEDQPTALAKAREACKMLVDGPVGTLGSILEEVGELLPGHRFASVRAGVEMALIDAVAKSIQIPLWRLFGAKTSSITTNITIPIVSPNDAAELAANYCKQGFSTLKLKVGKDLNSDIEVLRAVRLAHPDCSFILDANEGYSSTEAIEVIDRLHGFLIWILPFFCHMIQLLEVMKYLAPYTSSQMPEDTVVFFLGNLLPGPYESD